MRGDLENAVDRRVADGLARPQMRGAERLDDGRSGRVPVTEDAGQTSLAAQRRDQLRRKARRAVRKVTPLKSHRHPASSQCPDGVSLPRETSARNRSGRAGFDFKARRNAPCREVTGATEAEPTRFGSVSGPVRRPGRSAPPARKACDMPNRVRARVAVERRVGSAADANESITRTAARGIGYVLSQTGGCW